MTHNNKKKGADAQKKKKTNNMRLIKIITPILLMLLTACSSEALREDNAVGGAQNEQRRQVEVSFTASLGGEETRATAMAAGDGIAFEWKENETLDVFIQKTDNSIVPAGTVTTSGAAGKGVREFTGTVSALQSGEHYIYTTIPEGSPSGSNYTITYTTQQGELNSTAHLSKLIPLVWHDNGEPILTAEKQAYVLRLQLLFSEEPGNISSIQFQTMDMGDDGTTPDRIFPTSFKTENLANAVNNTLNSQTAGTSLSDGYTNEITLNITPSAPATRYQHQWKAEAYIAVPSVKNLNVFRTKYNVKVTTANGTTYYSDFRSFPGQQEASASAGLPMLKDGYCYTLKAACSKNAAMTIISDSYKVNSLLGMWSTFGKAFDPLGLIVTDENKLPTALKTNVIENKSTFTERTLVGKSSQGTPTFTWQLLTNQITGATDSYKQANVSYNNINITKDTEVFVTFISEYAWGQNLLGYYTYLTGEVPESPEGVEKNLIFPNMSKGGHVPFNKNGIDGGANINPNGAKQNIGNIVDGPLQEYTTVQLLYRNADGMLTKTFPKGTTIGFMMMCDPKASNGTSDEGTMGDSGDISHSGYKPRTDNTLLDWTAWRMFTNTKWNSMSGNTGWWDSNCQNFFVSGDVGNESGVIPGLAIYGAKDDKSHNYNYSFSAMLFMVSTSDPSAMQTQNKAYFNLGTGETVKQKP